MDKSTLRLKDSTPEEFTNFKIQYLNLLRAYIIFFQQQ